ncbi:MAG: carboxypeptidase regulatory-like domain-containing protein [Planctomycetes bacterium]|nr:carboxypeptidase regulatory-like domain-containing protein [Planctomycetota bacterium]
MQKPTLAVLLGGLLLCAGGGLWLATLAGDDEAPIRRWQERDEQEVASTTDGEGADLAGSPSVERTAVADSGFQGADDEARVAVLLRGRVVDKFQGPVAGATVWLDFGRSGQRQGPGGGPGGNNRTRRVPDPVQTDREGRFAFQGQAFRNLRVSLQVAHGQHAPGLFDRDLGQVAAETDLGDLQLMHGGGVLGRVTDLEGNGIPSAVLKLSPENTNRFRLLRNRDNLLAELKTDPNGYFRGPHLPAGDWSLSATAAKHTEGRSSTFAIEEDQQANLDDIRLGPGYEVTGYVRTTAGQPIAKAEVTLRGTPPSGNGPSGNGQAGPGAGNGNGGRGGRGQDWRNFGREHTATTDAQGRFFLDHLPGVPMRVESRADGFLDHQLENVDVTTGQPLQIAMQDGLRIAGTALDSVDGQPVTRFAFRAVRLRGLPQAGQGEVDIQALMARMGEPNLDDATRQQLRSQIDALRASFRDPRDQRRPGQGGRGGNEDNGGRQGGPGGLARDLGKPENHPDGTFVATGLQEGVYEVHVQSPDHARFRSAEVEVRAGAGIPTVQAGLDRGVYVAGVVLDDRGEPLAGAKVELRSASTAENAMRSRRRGGNQDNNPGGDLANVDFAAVGRDWQRFAAGAMVQLEATTDATGEFVIRHVPRGTFRLTAEAKGFAAHSMEPFELAADRSDFQLALTKLGAIAGTVRGVGKDHAAVRVAAVPLDLGAMGRGRGGMMGMFGGGGPGGGGPGGGGPFRSVNVEPDGAYRIADLAPGKYLVRSWIGSPQELMRELGPQFFAGTLAADVEVRGGDTARCDPTVLRPQLGEVTGSVQHNGAPATGFQVELTRLDDGADAGNNERRGPGGPGGGRGMWGGMMGGRSLQATVASSGRFHLEEVPAGTYRLRAQGGRRGSASQEQEVVVVADRTTDVAISLWTAVVQGTVTCTDANPAELQGMVALHAGATALAEIQGNAGRDFGGGQPVARLQNGAFQFEAVVPGNYLLVLTVRGRERSGIPVTVGPAGLSGVQLEAGKPSAPGAAAPAAPGQNGAGQGRGAGGRGAAGR